MAKVVDIESGGKLYPGMTESLVFRWDFIKKVYIILSLQMILTVAVSSVVFFVPAIPQFITKTTPALILFFVSLILPFIIMFPLFAYEKKHPINLILLMIFTLTLAFAIGLSCSFSKGRIVLEAALLTAVMVVGLTIYTFWAVKRGHDFSFLGPFLFGALLNITVFSLIQIFYPLGKLSTMVFSGVAAIIFCGYIVYDTHLLIEEHSYEDYIIASVFLYLDIFNVFLNLLQILGELDDD